MVTMRRGRRICSAIAVAATASGGETMAPKAKATAQGIAGTTERSAIPTTNVVNSTSPKASRKMGRQLALNSCQEVNHPAA
jgi:hypothetical protein